MNRAQGARRTVQGAWLSLALCAFLFTAPVLSAQESPSRPAIVSVSHWAKWPALAAAAGFTTVALMRNRDADRVYDALTAFCTGAQDACRTVTVDGVRRYTGDDAERLYQETLRLDHSARTWLIVGQLSLIASGGMFLLDLISHDDGPANIPYRGLSVVADGRRLGLNVRF